MDKIFSPIKQRVLQFVENQHISKEEFFKKTGISSSNFKGKGAESELGGEKIVKILSIFPDINPEWLVLGRGNMRKELVKTHTLNEPETPEYGPNGRIIARQDLDKWRPETLGSQYTFSELEEIEMTIISRTLADLLVKSSKQDIDIERPYRIKACRADALEYYTQKYADPQLQ